MPSTMIPDLSICGTGPLPLMKKSFRAFLTETV
jgi:hypothetical protein